MNILIVMTSTGVFWFISLIIFICSKAWTLKIVKQKNLCSEQTTAIVVNIEEVRKRNVNTYYYTWYPVYEYTVNNQKILKRNDIGISKNCLQQGQQVTVYYNPQNPYEIYVPSENQTSIIKILNIIATSFLICGFLPGLIMFILIKNNLI